MIVLLQSSVAAALATLAAAERCTCVGVICSEPRQAAAVLACGLVVDPTVPDAVTAEALT